MAKVKVEVTGAVVDGSPSGSTIEINKRSAEALEARGYVKIIGKVSETKKESAPKKSPKAKPKPKSKDK